MTGKLSGHVTVVGSINVDIVARAPTLPRAGETVAGGDLTLFLGGKGANQAVAAARAGAPVDLIGCIGTPSFGLSLREEIAAYGVDPSTLIETDAPTGAALIAVDDKGENQIVVSPGANARLTAEMVGMLSPGRVVLAQRETPAAATLAAFEKAALAILNLAPAVETSDTLLRATDILVVNEVELSGLAQTPLSDADDTATIVAAMRAARRRPDQIIIATLGLRGALAVQGDDVIEQPVFAAEVRDTTGAGDCFCGALAARLAAGTALPDAMRFAAAAASLCVEKNGAAPSMPEARAIHARLAR